MANAHPQIRGLPALLPVPQEMEWRSGPAALRPLVTETVPAAAAPNDAPESYRLILGADGARLRAERHRARQHGQRTLEQLDKQAHDAPLPSALALYDYPTLDVRGVHVDLKYLAPRFDWLLSWIEQLAAWKLNTVVLEYEDKFPYEKAAGLADPTAWSRDQVREFVARAGQLGLTVVPLVQCLGHWEYVLVHERYAALRERPEVYSQACPCRPETFELFRTMAGEVLELHPDSPFLHIGADETAFLGRCPACAEAVRTSGPVALYGRYIAQVCAWVKSAGRRPILWDDILRREPARVRDLPHGSILMYWNYGASAEGNAPGKRRAGASAGKWGQIPFCPSKMVSVPTFQRAEPVYAQYRAAGYDVLMAPCFVEGGLVPDVVGRPANCRHLAEEAARYGSLGTVATNWACLFTPLALAYHGLAATADAAWNPAPSRTELLSDRRPAVALEFHRRFCREFCGLDDEDLVNALALLDTSCMFVPGGQVYPTYVSEPMFVDPSFLLDREEYAALGAAFFRPAWPTRAREFPPERTWAAKVRALRAHPNAAKIGALVQDQLRRSRNGMELLASCQRAALRGHEFLDGLGLAARARIWRLETLVGELSGDNGAAGVARPDVREGLTAFYEKSLEPAAARTLSQWLLSGLPK